MIQSKQIESLVARKVITNDDMMFIKNTQLEKIGNCKVESFETKSELPSVGKESVLYIVNTDESNGNNPCIYIYKDNSYKMVSGGGSGNGGVSRFSNATYIKEISESDWITDGNDKVIEIPVDEHNQESDSIIILVFEDGENVIVPYSIDLDRNVRIFSQTAFSGKIIVSDLISHAHGNMEVLSKFSEDNGTLLFDGSPIKGSGGSGNPLMTQPLEYGWFNFTTKSTIGDDIPVNENNTNMLIENDYPILKAGKMYRVATNLNSCNFTGTSGKVVVDVKCGEVVLHTVSLNRISTNDSAMYSGSAIEYFTPDKDVALKPTFRTATSFTTYELEINIEEVRSNPVNQYGGFETEVLFDGNGVHGLYTLSDDVDNYNFLFVIHEMKRDTKGKSLIPVMRSNTEPAPYIASASSENNPASGAFDGVAGHSVNTWYSEVGLPQWLDIYGGTPLRVSSFSLSNGSGSSGYHNYPPKTFKFQGSNDGVTYDDLLEVVDMPRMNESEEVVFDLDEVAEYSHYRWHFTEGYNNAIIVGEAKLFGESFEIENSNIVIPNTRKEHHIELYDKFVILAFDKDSMNVLNDSGLTIKKVVGVKGQLPTELIGGTF